MWEVTIPNINASGGVLEKVRTPAGGGRPNSMKVYKGGGGVKKAKNRVYVLYGCRQMTVPGGCFLVKLLDFTSFDQ